MTLEVRLADLKHDGGPLLKLLHRELSRNIDSARFEWLYRKAPCGEGTVWLAKDLDSGELVGAAAAFPRQIFLKGRRETACVLGDFCISTKYRTLGPALQLQRKVMEAISTGNQKGLFSRGYDLPSTSMLAVYKRLGVQPKGQCVRMTRLLRSRRKVESRLRLRPVARAVSAAVDVILGMSGGMTGARSDAKIEMLQERCGEEFTQLADRVRDRWGTCGTRSADFLNWRYLDHPQRKYRVATARQQRALAGYVIWERNEGAVTVADWYAEDPREIRLDLMRTVVACAREENAEAVNVSVPAGHEFQRDLESIGFRAREASPLIFLGGGALEAEKWLLLDGDRES
jgi:hypothetical protein